MFFPELQEKGVAVLVVTAHGSVSARGTEPEQFQVPDGMARFAYIRAVQPGVCNVATKQSMEYLAAGVRDLSVRAAADLKSDTGFDAFARELQQKLRALNGFFLPSLMRNNPDKTETARIAQFSDNMYGLQIRVAGESVVEKQFFVDRETDAWSNDDGSVRTAYSHSMFIANLAGAPDVLHMMQRRSNHRQTIVRFSEVVQFLADHGVRKLIVVDMSCSAVQDPVTHVRASRRTERSIRRKFSGGGRRISSTRRKKIRESTRKIRAQKGRR